MVEANHDEGIGLQAILNKAHAAVRASNADGDSASGASDSQKHAITACIIIAGTNDLATQFSADDVSATPPPPPAIIDESCALV